MADGNMAELKELGTLIVVVGKAVRHWILLSKDSLDHVKLISVAQPAQQVTLRQAGSFLHGSHQRGKAADQGYQAVSFPHVLPVRSA